MPPPTLPKWSPDREVWKASTKITAEEMLVTREKYRKGELERGTSKKLLWVCVNRYVRKGLKSDSNGVTLFFAHANGFPKEIWEPALQHLVAAGQVPGTTYTIDEIWTWEAVNHGDSALVNGENLGWAYDWQDNTRDILQFMLSYLPSSASPSALPIHLERLPDHVSDVRKVHGFDERTMVVVGHSLGGCTTSLAALNCPRLFSSLVLIDPVIFDPSPSDFKIETQRISNTVLGTLQRRDRWPSRQDAREKFAAVPFFAAWDPAVLDMYVESGLRDDPATGDVVLKMPSIQEAVVFNDISTGFEVWDVLDELDERVELRFLFPDKLPPITFQMRERLTWRRPTNSSNIIFRNAGHLIAQEIPAEMAQDLHNFLQRKYGAELAKL
ncbi:alpha/beta-hydrolase [Sparassis crispa]|uniref:Alpha/beta-hydrolase n=1 Tax=Sparassis crispa TaxID=139825 RepID=A0A401GKG2_9APHY|nr:alpha/beta-hydrolase [Sparassis crispa]GBE82655.1 alpha/beta-hydrolase [Sparassis crispa]